MQCHCKIKPLKSDERRLLDMYYSSVRVPLKVNLDLNSRHEVVRMAECGVQRRLEEEGLPAASQ